jgi:hypothetical protein
MAVEFFRDGFGEVFGLFSSRAMKMMNILLPSKFIFCQSSAIHNQVICSYVSSFVCIDSRCFIRCAALLNRLKWYPAMYN